MFFRGNKFELIWCTYCFFYRVTMTTWTCDDRLVITAVSDASLHAWDSQTSQLLYRLKGHKVRKY